jgi:hypothetical protein
MVAEMEVYPDVEADYTGIGSGSRRVHTRLCSQTGSSNHFVELITK